MRITEVLAAKTGPAAGGPAQDEAGAGGGVRTISPDATVRELVALLGAHNIGAVVVSADGTSVDGIVSERDVVRHLDRDDDVLASPVSALMSREVVTCRGDQTAIDLMGLMTQRRIRHVPVVDDGRLTGIVSIGDVVKSRMSELEFERDQLDSYVQNAQT